jgi:hypothetical protein
MTGSPSSTRSSSSIICHCPIVRAPLDRGALQRGGRWFDIATGDTFAYRPETDAYVLIGRALAEKFTEE